MVIFCHGSATTIDGLAPALEPLTAKADVSLVLFSYRGYGRSTPRENVTRRTTVQDARAALDAVAAMPQVDADRIILMGYSLGAVPALAVAAERPEVVGVIVGGTYARASLALEDLGQSIAYPLIGGDFDPARSAAKLGERPLFILHGEDDPNPAPYHAYLLAADASRAGVPVQVRIVPEASHYDVLERDPQLLDDLAVFIESLP